MPKKWFDPKNVPIYAAIVTSIITIVSQYYTGKRLKRQDRLQKLKVEALEAIQLQKISQHKRKVIDEISTLKIKGVQNKSSLLKKLSSSTFRNESKNDELFLVTFEFINRSIKDDFKYSKMSMQELIQLRQEYQNFEIDGSYLLKGMVGINMEDNINYQKIQETNRTIIRRRQLMKKKE